MATPTVQDLRQYLDSLTHEELMESVVQLYWQNEGAREFYTARMGLQPDESVLDKYKATIRNEFFPMRGTGHGRLSVARKAITDYQKIAQHTPYLIELMLFYVEQSIAYAKTDSNITEAFYTGMATMFERALAIIAENQLQASYQERSARLVKEIGAFRGEFSDTISTSYATVYGDSVVR